MSEKIKLPNNKKMKSCYDLIRKEAPDLYRSLNEDLLSTANEDKSADVRFEDLPKLAGKMWADFLLKDKAHKSKVIKSSWDCCVGDLADALLTIAIQEIVGSDQSPQNKGGRLDTLLNVVKNDLYETPTNPGMVLNILMAKNSLT